MPTPHSPVGATTAMHAPAKRAERPASGVANRTGPVPAPSMFRYRPVPPVGFDDEGYPCEDSAVQNVPHARVSNYLAYTLQTRYGERAFVGDDLALLYRRGDRGAVLVPDTFVSFGADPGKWRSYKLWEQPVPDFVLEVVSESTKKKDVGDKRYTYETLGVTELWLFDPTGWLLAPRLQAYRLRQGRYRALRPNAAGHLHSRTLGLELRVVEDDAEPPLAGTAALRWYDPVAGETLRSHREAETARREAETARHKAETARHQAMRHAAADRAARLAAEERAAADRDARRKAEQQLAAALAGAEAAGRKQES